LSPTTGFLQIDQGVGAGQRIGNVIRIKKCMFTFILFPNPYNAVTNPGAIPLEVRMWIFSDKQIPQTPVVGNEFIQLGGSSTALTGTLVDMTSPVNKDRYQLFRTKVFKLGHSIYNGTGNNPNEQYNSSNDFKMNVKYSINVTKYMIKTVKFNDTNSQPNSRQLCAMFEPVYANNNVVGAISVPSSITYTLDLSYEDA